MIKKILVVFFMLMVFTVCQSGAAIVYNLNISDIDYTGVAPLDQIANFSATLNGDFGTDWTLGAAFEPYATDWFFSGGANAIGADATVAGSSPLLNGDIIEIISPNDNAGLMITAFTANTYTFPNEYAGTVTATLVPPAPIPIPGSILLLGSGLVGLVGLIRRKRS